MEDWEKSFPFPQACPCTAEPSTEAHSKQSSQGQTPWRLSQGKGPAQGAAAYLAEQLLVPSVLDLLSPCSPRSTHLFQLAATRL